MSIMSKAGYMLAFLFCMGMWWIALVCYFSHMLYTVLNISSAEHSGYAFYLVMGVLFPPLGVVNGMLMYLI